jgi:hypothetical protein
MIYSPNIVFIHFQKTGGMSVTSHLINILDDPVTLIAWERSHAATRKSALTPERRDKLTCIVGERHAKPADAFEIMAANDLPPPDRAFVMIRHPVELMLSYYKHLRKPRVWAHRGMTEDTLVGHVRVAVQQNFGQFIKKVRFYGQSDEDLARFFDPAGFKTLDVVPLHRIDEYLELRFGDNKNFPGVKMPHNNGSKGGRTLDSIPDKVKQQICETYPNLLKIYEDACNASW